MSSKYASDTKQNSSPLDARIAERDLEFGEIVPNESIEYAFTILNQSNRELHIKSVKPSCPCISIKSDARNINPFSKINVQFSYNPGYVQGKHFGSVAVTFDSKDHFDKALILSFSASVSPLLLYEGFSISLGNIPVSQNSYRKKVILHRANTHISWDTLRLCKSPNNISARIKKVSDNDFELELVIDPAKIPIGLYHGNLVFHFLKNEKTLPLEFGIPINGEVVSNVDFMPKCIYLSKVKPKQNSEVKFTLHCQDNVSSGEVTVLGNDVIRVSNQRSRFEGNDFTVDLDLAIFAATIETTQNLLILAEVNGRKYTISVPVVYIVDLD